MRDPLEKAVAKAPPTIGGGCTQRFDPDSLNPEDGTDFPGAEELWQQIQMTEGRPRTPNMDGSPSKP